MIDDLRRDWRRWTTAERVSASAIVAILLVCHSMKIDVDHDVWSVALRIGGNHASEVEAFIFRRAEHLVDVERLLVREVWPFG